VNVAVGVAVGLVLEFQLRRMSRKATQRRHCIVELHQRQKDLSLSRLHTRLSAH
jgi:hypothetical protein